MKDSLGKTIYLIVIFAILLSSCNNSNTSGGIDLVDTVTNTPSPTIVSSETTKTPTPSLTSEEKQSLVPNQTEESLETPEPIETSEPSATPGPTVVPDQTAAPVPAETTGPYATPDPSTAPEASATPETSTTPEPTSIPNSIINSNNGLILDYLQAPSPIIFEDISNVTIYKSSFIYMPDLVGRSEKEAIDLILSTNVINYRVDYEYNEYVPEGLVYKQSYPRFADLRLYNNYLSWFTITIKVSLGPNPYYHNEIISICKEKGWSIELWPYIAAGAKTIIHDIGLDADVLLQRLRSNINEIRVLDIEESAAVEYKGVFNTKTKDIGISCFRVEESTFTHEMLHAVSFDPATGKIGLSRDGLYFREAVEAWTDYLADRKFPIYDWNNFILQDNLDRMLITSDVHMCNGPYNLYLQLYSPFFQLAGEDLIMKAFLGDAGEYEAAEQVFNDIYGEGKWEFLLQKGHSFLSSENESNTDEITEYYETVFNLLAEEAEKCFEEKTLLLAMFEKVKRMEGSFPLNFNDFRSRFSDLKTNLVDRYNLISEEDLEYLKYGYFNLENIYKESAAKTISTLTNQGGAKNIDLVISSMSNSDLPYGIEQLDIRNPREDHPYPWTGWEFIHFDPIYGFKEIIYERYIDLPINYEYRIWLSLGKASVENFYITDDLVTMFEGQRLNFNFPNINGAIKYIKDAGMDYEINYIEVENLGDYNNGRLVEQFPEPGTALYKGGSKIILTFLKNAGN